MRCEDVKRHLEAFPVGELPAEVRRGVQAHLAECAACRAALAEIDPLAGVLADAASPPVPTGFSSRVMTAARQRLRAGRRAASWNPMRWWRLTSTPMHAAAAAVLIVGLTIGLAMGWTAAPSPAQVESPGQPDPVDAYRLDYLGEAPSGSLADSYLTLVSAAEEGGR